MQPRSQSFFAALNCSWSRWNEYARSAMARPTSTATMPRMYFTTWRIQFPIPDDRIAGVGPETSASVKERGACESQAHSEIHRVANVLAWPTRHQPPRWIERGRSSMPDESKRKKCAGKKTRTRPMKSVEHVIARRTTVHDKRTVGRTRRANRIYGTRVPEGNPRPPTNVITVPRRTPMERMAAVIVLTGRSFRGISPPILQTPPDTTHGRAGKRKALSTSPMMHGLGEQASVTARA